MRLLTWTPVVAVLLGGLALGGCALEESQCRDGERPVYALTNPGGAECVEDGEDPPEGFADYPEGRVPQVVGDDYDRWPLADNYPWADEVDPALREESARLQAQQD